MARLILLKLQPNQDTLHCNTVLLVLLRQKQDALLAFEFEKLNRSTLLASKLPASLLGRFIPIGMRWHEDHRICCDNMARTRTIQYGCACIFFSREYQHVPVSAQSWRHFLFIKLLAGQ